MFGALFFNLIAVLLARIALLKDYQQQALRLSLICIFCFLALRYDYGNDYISYLELFYEINNYSIFTLSNFVIKGNEIGWVYLNYLFDTFGFFAMQIFLAGLSCIILYRFIKKYVAPKYYWWAIFIYTFQPYHMIVQSSAMRQAVVISLFLLAIDFLIEKKPFHYIGIILFGTLFHTTAYFLLPLIILSYFKIQMNFKYVIITVLLFFGFFIVTDQIFDQVQQFISMYFEKEYSGHMQQDVKVATVGIGFILNFSIYIILFYYTQHQNSNWKIMILNIVIISFLIIPLTFSLPLISRINLYFTPLLMSAYPLAFENIKNKTIRIGFMVLIALSTIYQFFYFFRSETWIEKFYEYKTIFSAPIFY
jgi:hypothetical protein